jgi:hypothetical protein
VIDALLRLHFLSSIHVKEEDDSTYPFLMMTMGVLLANTTYPLD